MSLSILPQRLRAFSDITNIEYVGGVVGGALDGGSVSLTALTGGIGSAALAGDTVIGFMCLNNSSDDALLIGTGYTLLGSELYVATGGVNLRAARKVMGGSPDTSLAFSSTLGGEAAWGAMVFRGINGTPLDVAVVTAVGANSDVTNANPGAITPVNLGALVVAIGGGCSTAATTNFTSSDLSNFIQHTRSATSRVQVGAGTALWSGSGAINPAAFGGGNSDTSSDWAAITLALRSA